MGRSVVKDVVEFCGHANVLSFHPTTIEVTTEGHLTRNGDCIIGVSASKGCGQLDERLKEELKRDGSRVTVTIAVGGDEFVVKAKGDPRLKLTHPHDIVIRKSDFVSDRTLAVGADAAACDIPRTLIEKLKDPGVNGTMSIEVS